MVKSVRRKPSYSRRRRSIRVMKSQSRSTKRVYKSRSRKMSRRRSRSRRSRMKYSKFRSYSRGSHSSQWITRPGKLGGRGFLEKPVATQHKLLSKCVKEYGYRSCLGSIIVLTRNRRVDELHGPQLDSLKNWLNKKYGRKGSI
jgi:hypothetical protein